ncbi:MAG: hypothetical protein IPP57_04975 [Candidatus Obscuribacter sp.]|nr:hypothetical protein [Candidatus Obscuribacter sp.]
MVKRSSKILVGDLLVKSELVTLAQFADAMPVSLKTGLPVGRVLIASGFLDEEKFKQVLTVQSLIRDHLLAGEAGVEALKLVASGKRTLTQALTELGENCDFFDSTNRLGDILLDAQIVDESMLKETLTVSLTTGLPLARVLSMRGYLAEQVAYIALCCQTLIRDGKLDRQRAMSAIKLVNENLQQILKLGITSRPGDISLRKANSLRLGELLVLNFLGLAQSVDFKKLKEESAREKITLEESVKKANLISPMLEKSVLEAYHLYQEGRLEDDQCAFAVHVLAASGQGDLPELLKQLGW